MGSGIIAVSEQRSFLGFCEKVNEHCYSHKIRGLANLGKMDYVESSSSSKSSASSSGSSALGESQPLPESSFILPVCATYISSFSPPSSMYHPQLTQTTSAYVFLQVMCLPVLEQQAFCKDPVVAFYRVFPAISILIFL
jgi:hypothetical protein